MCKPKIVSENEDLGVLTRSTECDVGGRQNSGRVPQELVLLPPIRNRWPSLAKRN
jgi:hypothetical protein